MNESLSVIFSKYPSLGFTKTFNRSYAVKCDAMNRHVDGLPTVIDISKMGTTLIKRRYDA